VDMFRNQAERIFESWDEYGVWLRDEMRQIREERERRRRYDGVAVRLDRVDSTD